MTHPAHLMAFDDLIAGLMDAVTNGNVRRKYQPSTGLSTFCYSESCVYNRAWNDYSLVARGIILDEAERRIIATPFPKFFNLGERVDSFPNMPFEAFEKLDGSLIIIFWHACEWRCATKGSFESDQAKWAKAWIDQCDLSSLEHGTTYLAEAIYPENRIVVRYDEPALVMLAAYRSDGAELSYDDIQQACLALGWRAAKRYAFQGISELIAKASTLTSQEEGFVIRFESGYRLKVKGDEYRRVHALISRCTPLAMWEAMMAGDDMMAIRKELPEEFWNDFDQITSILSQRYDELTYAIGEIATSVNSLSDKELGLSLRSIDEKVRPFLFPYRKSGGEIEGRLREAIYRGLRPSANVLPGYTPSYAINRVKEEAV